MPREAADAKARLAVVDDIVLRVGFAGEAGRAVMQKTWLRTGLWRGSKDIEVTPWRR
jgi:hypothetical protein